VISPVILEFSEDNVQCAIYFLGNLLMDGFGPFFLWGECFHPERLPMQAVDWTKAFSNSTVFRLWFSLRSGCAVHIDAASRAKTLSGIWAAVLAA
jgi:hypothetical protein